ncbi:hypothetical protein CPB86DRAFT_792551 [Serendipita vermifera]|nr:hypothetical protein CPB86DRAFT_792551 [Serendipita vermifera]
MGRVSSRVGKPKSVEGTRRAHLPKKDAGEWTRFGGRELSARVRVKLELNGVKTRGNGSKETCNGEKPLPVVSPPAKKTGKFTAFINGIHKLGEKKVRGKCALKSLFLSRQDTNREERPYRDEDMIFTLRTGMIHQEKVDRVLKVVSFSIS